ncbi:DUF4349 domain-containing protein [Halorubrum sp. 48-1-W]|uniref:DUF4349 domain-containing protein n=1 Tax=Halorubrum sp. 48-1-W TaxID=2249761 RepID=UPI000DCBAB20|nr:DUF4349 domain-containing protein [Halorubrum sp. 48-1-W]RAW46188.1 DUF4349 domain-containing protein [Halorubrum sp. 48-1-W]
MDTRRLLLVVTVAGLVALAGCSGAGTGGAGGGADAGDDAPETASPEGDGAGASNGDDGATESSDIATEDGETVTAVAERRLIRTGDLRVTVDSFAEADAEARTVAEEYGGFVSESTRETHERGDEEFTGGTLTLRVPSEEFDAVMADLEALGDVERSTTESRDVTDRIADLEARLENKRAERDRLRELYEGADTTEDVLAVQRELADVQEEIERMEAERAALEERVALSTIRVELREEPPEPSAVSTAWYDTGVATAFLESVRGLGTLLRAVVVGTAYALPYLLTAGVPLLGVGFAIRRRVRRSMATSEPED